MAKNLPIYLLMTVGIVVFVYFVLYRPYATHQEKKDFEKAEAALNELYDKIVAKIGKPDQEKKVNKCSYASREFGRGPRSCSVNIYVLYENRGLEAANTMTKNVATITGTQLYPGPGEESLAEFVVAQYPHVSQYFDQEFNDIESITCGARYSYPVYPTYSTIDPLQTTFHENLQIELSCSGSAKSEHYPVITR